MLSGCARILTSSISITTFRELVGSGPPARRPHPYAETTTIQACTGGRMTIYAMLTTSPRGMQ
jgi:hypothetical protein